MTRDQHTPREHTLEADLAPTPMVVQSLVLTIVDPKDAERTFRATGRVVSIGSHPSNDLVVADSTVSRFHCELAVGLDGVRVIDKASRNGTVVDGVRVKECWLALGSHVRLGRVTVRFDAAERAEPVELSQSARFGLLVGASAPMRAVFSLLERAAGSGATVLLEGETGTGKGAAAESIHRAGARRDQPFVVVDCGAIAPTLLESELFGHERGAFTGAAGRRVGAFEEAHEGTIFIDEIGELPLDLQPKLLRALDKREVRRLGQNSFVTVDVRVIAATNRDLRAMVNESKFRSDLYYRLAVLRAQMPPLRHRLADLPLLVDQLLDTLRASGELRHRLTAAPFLARLQHSAWPGNVRELRNYLERCLVLRDPPRLGDPAAEHGLVPVDDGVPLAEARRRALENVERRYLETLMQRHRGRVAAVARAAGVGRVYMYRLLAKHGLGPG
jgi:DNA-binding NtrC family response regulator